MSGRHTPAPKRAPFSDPRFASRPVLTSAYIANCQAARMNAARGFDPARPEGGPLTFAMLDDGIIAAFSLGRHEL